MEKAFDHPVIDSDGHTVEFMPALLDVLTEVAGSEITQRYSEFFSRGFLGWYELTPAQRAERQPTSVFVGTFEL